MYDYRNLRAQPRPQDAWRYSWEDDQRPPQNRPALFLVLAFVIALGPVLYRFTGPPRLPFPLPARVPTWHEVWAVLTGPGPDLTVEQVAPWFFAVCWAFWAWSVWTFAVEAVLTIAELVTRGAAWVRGLRAAFNRVTLPQMRRLANGAMVATAVVQLASRPSGAEASGSRQEVAVVTVPERSPHAADTLPLQSASEAQREHANWGPVAHYTVRPGDNLWEIASRFYGSGWEFTRIAEANAGRRMPDGWWFRRADAIRPGWELILPLPATRLEQRLGRTEYVIQPAETLAGIAARLTGDEFQWVQLVRANRIEAPVHPAFVDASTRADSLWPSMRLTVPDAMLPLLTAQSGSATNPPGVVAMGSRGALPVECTVIQIAASLAPAADARALASTTEGRTETAAPASAPPGESAANPARDPASAPASAGTKGAPLGVPSPTAVLLGAAFAAGAITGGGAVAARKRLRRGLDEPPSRRLREPFGRSSIWTAELGGSPTTVDIPGHAPLRLVPTPLPAATRASGADGPSALRPRPDWASDQTAFAPPGAALERVSWDDPAALPAGAAPSTFSDVGLAESPASPAQPPAELAEAGERERPGTQELPRAQQPDREDDRPPIWLRCFGPLRVTARTAAGERELGDQAGGEAHHKPWSLLVYLACRPGGTATADRLVETFWGEVDSGDVNRSLRVTLARLRKLIRAQVPELPADADLVLSERDGRRRLDPCSIGSDVQRFAALCEAAEKLPPERARPLYEEALALYRGELLQDAPFVWLDERERDGLTLRERYAEAHRRVANALAAVYRRSGRVDEAIALYESLLRAEPTLQDIARDLYRCYEKTGDLPALLRAHARLRQGLRDVYGPDLPAGVDADDLAPQPETERVFRQVEETLRKRLGASDSDYGLTRPGDPAERAA